MIEPINPALKSQSARLSRSGSAPVPPDSSPPPASGGDQVSLNTDSLLDTLKNEVAGLKNDLPALIQQALLAPPGAEAVRQEPLNALIFRLQDPLKTILGATEDLPPELIVQIQDELKTFKLVLPELKNQELLSPFLNDPERAGPLTGLLQSLTGQVDLLLGEVAGR